MTQSKGTARLRDELNKARDVLAEVSALRLEMQLKNGKSFDEVIIYQHLIILYSLRLKVESLPQF